VDVVIYDTDVASQLIRRRLEPTFLATLAPYAPCVTFVTIGELAEWGYTRNWSHRSMLGIDAWLSRVPKIWCDETIARTWGRLSAETRRAGRPRPVNDMWNAACCIAHGLPLVTFNIKDYQDFVDHHGLQIISAS
jgi:predicted nucleic acid-binding protein